MSATATLAPVADDVRDLADWLAEQSWSEFAQSLATYHRRHGRLSPAQIAAGERMRAKVLARAAAAPVADAPADPVTEVGFYLVAGRVWKVKRSQAGRLYAVVRTPEGDWDYEANAIRNIAAADKINPAQAAEFGLRTGICIFCNAELDDRDGLGQRVGVGPVCSRKHLGMTQRQLAAHLGV
jgi:soluble lytic murein transglycosylase-like protein